MGNTTTFYQELEDAIKKGDVEFVKKVCSENELLSMSVNRSYRPFREVYQRGTQLLRVAVKSKQYKFEIVETLVKKDARLIEMHDADYNTPMHYAVLLQRHDAVKLFAETSPKVVTMMNICKATPIEVAVDCADVDTLKLLLEISNEANIICSKNICNLMRLAVIRDANDMIDLLADIDISSVNAVEENGYTPLHCDTIVNNISTIMRDADAIIDLFTNIDISSINEMEENGYTPLQCAAIVNNISTIK